MTLCPSCALFRIEGSFPEHDLFSGSAAGVTLDAEGEGVGFCGGCPGRGRGNRGDCLRETCRGFFGVADHCFSCSVCVSLLCVLLKLVCSGSAAWVFGCVDWIVSSIFSPPFD